MSKMILEAWNEEFSLNTFVGQYSTNGNLYIGLHEDDGPFADLTTNIASLGDSCAAIDTNNCPWAEELIKRYKLGEKTGYSLRSGFCDYPVYRFNMDKVKEFEA